LPANLPAIRRLQNQNCRSLLKISLLPFGSAGDVLPFLWLARHLRARGHDVTLITASLFRQAVEKAAIPFVPIGRDEDFELLMRDPRLWKMGSGTRAVFEYAGHAATLYFATLASHHQRTGQPDLLLAPVTAFGARLARETFAIPLVTVHLQPAVLLSAYDTPVVFPALHRVLRLLPPSVKRFLFDHGPNPLDFFAGRALRQLCHAHGIRPPKSFFREWWDSPDGSLLLFPEWFAPPQPDWPHPRLQADFPLEDLSSEQPLPPALTAFLDTHAGTPPVIFTAGSANVQAASFFATAKAALEQIQRPGVFVTRDLAQLPADLPPSIHAAEYTPFGPLLKQAAAFVHHGGIGTLSQGFAAGVPQLLMPMAHDQPDNARRLLHLGAGDFLIPRHFTPDRVSAKLQHLLQSNAVALASARVTRSMQAARAARALDSILPWLEAAATRGITSTKATRP
jgi:rhamnosyltransferase subunit B